MTIDFHTHIFPPELRAQRERYLSRDATFRELFGHPRAKLATADELVEAMDRDGVSRSVVMGMGWTDPGLGREVNDYIIDSVRRRPDRLAGFAGVNPAWGSDAAKELGRCAAQGLIGVGELHPDTQSYDLGDRAVMAPVMEVAAERGLMVTTHSSEPVGHQYAGKGTTGPESLWKLIVNFPEVTIVCAHWGGGLPFYGLMPEVADSIANVYFDTAASPFLYSPTVFSTVAGLVGVERILLASDYPLMSISRVRDQLEGSGLSEQAVRSIASENAARLLDRAAGLAPTRGPSA